VGPDHFHFRLLLSTAFFSHVRQIVKMHFRSDRQADRAETSLFQETEEFLADFCISSHLRLEIRQPSQYLFPKGEGILTAFWRSICCKRISARHGRRPKMIVWMAQSLQWRLAFCSLRVRIRCGYYRVLEAYSEGSDEHFIL
jgi:hypothetical protein